MKIRNDISMGNLSDVGRERTQNEDYFGYWEPDEDHVFQRKGRLAIVADGMGGHVGGFAASRLAVETVKSHYQSDSANIQDSLKRAIEQANASIFERGRREPDLEGMGTTCTSMVIHNGLAYIAHVGDSRIYRIRNGQIQQLTFDHSWVQQMVRDGHLTPDEAVNHPKSNVVLRSVGTKPSVEVDAYDPVPVARGDIYLLCSDGLTGLVNDEEICGIAANNQPQSACQKLVNLANQRGGHDNITVQIIRIDSLDGRPPADALAPRETRPIASPKPEKPEFSSKTEKMPPDPSSSPAKIIVPALLAVLLIAGIGVFLFNKKEPAPAETPLQPTEPIEQTQQAKPIEPTKQPTEPDLPKSQPADPQKIAERKIDFKLIQFEGKSGEGIFINEDTPLFVNDEKKFYVLHKGKVFYAEDNKPDKAVFQELDVRIPEEDMKNFHRFYNDGKNNLYFAFKDGENNIVIKKANQENKNFSDPLINIGKEKEKTTPQTAYLKTVEPFEFSFFPINEKVFLLNIKEGTRLIDFNKAKIDIKIPNPHPISESFASNVWLGQKIRFFSKNDTGTIYYEYIDAQKELTEVTPVNGLDANIIGVTNRNGTYYIFSNNKSIEMKDGKLGEVQDYLDNKGYPIEIDKMVKNPKSSVMIGLKFDKDGTKIYRMEFLK